MPHRTLHGFDFGRLRIGVAVGNTVTQTARALAIVEAEPLERRWKAIASLIDEWRPDLLVVGRPAVPAGDGGPPADEAQRKDAAPGAEAANRSNVHETAARCERFARQLAGRFRLPVEFVDESGSSLEAAAALAARGRRGADDAEAAAIILRQYLSHR